MCPGVINRNITLLSQTWVAAVTATCYHWCRTTDKTS